MGKGFLADLWDSHCLQLGREARAEMLFLTLSFTRVFESPVRKAIELVLQF